MPATNLTPAQRRLSAQAAINARWSRLPTAERRSATAEARAARMRKYETQVDPEGVLDPDERAKLARQALRSDMQKLALAASKARTARKAAGK